MNRLQLAFALACAAKTAWSLSSHSLKLPMRQTGSTMASLSDSKVIADRLTTAFEEMADSTEFIKRNAHGENLSYTIPAFGNDCMLFFHQSTSSERDLQRGPLISEAPTTSDTSSSDFVITLEGATKDDFGWICHKLYESRRSFDSILDLSNLRQELFFHMNNQPPHPGYDASKAKLAGSDTIRQLFRSTEKDPEMIMNELSSKGFVVLNGPTTSVKSNKNLSSYLQHKTGQSASIRTDTVAFLDRKDASLCGLQDQFDLLMGISSYLNSHFDFEPTGHASLAPATMQHPLTNPSRIQASKYGKGDFYVMHSDNSWAKGEHLTKRKNYRSFTAILYCNDNWSDADGGALRIYSDSTEWESCKDAKPTSDYTDVFPSNGRLVIFDSKLAHSVEKVLTDKERHALTVWILRPTEQSVEGEVVDVPP
ncbi:2-oxyglutarate/Fe(II) oxygenase [Nitzschia inconspicua]|uniref:2-oxyglutarate/Fe(II) oxygenase n=1 Tax=Nitzschia inconspicua TaxID=303405 RepID=A0A9K3Q8V5_9STRA|nr:2-oxyglutarate/Fe(II) oxygenase [Nitzschia inconspicua]